MPRTNATLIAEIIDLDESINVSAKITSANLLYNDVVKEGTHDEELAELIERWLAAHFYAIHDTRVVSETIDILTETKSNPVKPGLLSTLYGQQAMLLDTSGALAQWQKNFEGDGFSPKAKIGIQWLGTCY